MAGQTGTTEFTLRLSISSAEYERLYRGQAIPAQSLVIGTKFAG